MPLDIILIAYEFPPLARIGGMRPYKFALHLHEQGINPIVFTLDPLDYKGIYESFNLNVKLGDELSASGIEVYKIPIDKSFKKPGGKISRFIAIYFDIYRGWEHKTWKRNFNTLFAKIVKERKIKAILVTAPPFGMIKQAEEMSRKYQIPMIIDMRDAWSMWNNVPFGSIIHYWLTLRKERKYFNHAKKIIVTSKQTISEWKSLHRNIPPEKFVYIPNGYISESQYIPLVKIGFSPDKSPAVITHIGTFYYSYKDQENMRKPFYRKKLTSLLHYWPRIQDWKYKSPYYFFKAIKRVLEIRPDLLGKFVIYFAGNKEEWFDPMLKEFDLNMVVHLGQISYQDSLSLQSSSDFLLITSAKVIGGRDNPISGKTYEYMVMNKPVLSFTCEGAQKDLLNETGMTIEFDPDDTETNALRLIEVLTKGVQLSPDIGFIESFDVRKLSKSLAEEIKNAID